MPDAAKIELLIAPAGSGKTAAALQEYRRILAAGPVLQRRRVLWLTPTHAAAMAVRDALAEAASGALLEPGVRTFAAFASEVVWDAGLRVQVVSSLQRRRLLRRVIAEAARDGKLTYFGRVIDSSGLVNLVDEAIADLKRRDISAEAYQKAGRGALPRQREIADLYARYEKLLTDANLLDAEGLFRAARDGIQQASDVGTGIELIVVDGFTDFTTAQLEILQVLSQRARRLLVTLLGDGQREHRRADLFAKTQATRDALAKLGTTSPYSLQATAYSLPQALAHLERNLFRSYADIEPLSPAAEKSLDRAQLIAASGVQAELEQIARRVKRLLLDGVPPSEIVVTFRSLHDVADRLRGVLDDFGVPAHFDAPRRLAASPLVRSLLGVIRLHAEDWPYRRLLQVIGDQSLAALDIAGGPVQWSEDGSGHQPTPARAAAEFCVRHAQLPA
ncbi:MAG TPA: UvrD-helicase domain-containing protein, partial [Lacipirellula sp.]